MRFERMTYCLEGSCSIQLSYQGINQTQLIEQIYQKQIKYASLNFKNYKPIPIKRLHSKFCTIESTINAKIGEISIIPIGGITFLNGSKIKSVNFLIEYQGSLYQLKFGNHDKSTLINIINIIKLKS